MPTIIATPGGATSNSYATLEEVNEYFEARLPLSSPWEEAENPEAAILMAARVLTAFVQPLRTYHPAGATGGSRPYYLVRRTWTGSPATTIQRLAWPRIGMYDGNGNPIPSNVVPQELKEAQAELAGQLIISDTTLDNTATAEGIQSVKAGSVSITFKDMITQHILPDGVWLLMPHSWLTDEIWLPVNTLLFDVVSQ